MFLPFCTRTTTNFFSYINWMFFMSRLTLTKGLSL
jgi:hypothetical protein